MSASESEQTVLGPLPANHRGLHPALRLLLALFALSTTSCVGCLVMGYRTSRSGGNYVASELPRIAQPWNSAALVERASPEFLATMPAAKVEMFVSFAENRLGPLKEMGTVNNGPWRALAGTKGFVVTSVHWADCEFANAPARVSIQLIWRNGNRQIQGFNLSSDALMK